MTEFLFPGMDGDGRHPTPVLTGKLSRPLVVAWGMGVNSTAMLIGMEQRGIRPDLILAADTGGEKPETYEYAREFANWLHEADFPQVVMVRNDGIHGTLEQECLTNGQLPSKAYGWSKCSEKYKIRPQNKAVKAWPDAIACWADGRKVCKALGFHADEPHRADRLENDLYTFWYPLIEWDWGQQKCLDAINAAGLKPPPKSACFYCPSSTKKEVLWLYENHPDLFGRALAIEDAGLANATTVKGLGRRWSWRELVSLPLIDRAELCDPPESTCVCWDGED